MSENHCKDCCCARSWKALGIDSYTGLSIPEEIERLTTENERLRAALAESCDENRAHVLAEGPWSTDMCPIASKLSAEVKAANARERKAFEAGVAAVCRVAPPSRVDMMDWDDEEQWQKYRCQDDTDWVATDDPVSTQQESMATCTWQESSNPEYSVWETGCGNAFMFEADGPPENQFRFCCYCGGALVTHTQSGDADTQSGESND